VINFTALILTFYNYALLTGFCHIVCIFGVVAVFIFTAVFVVSAFYTLGSSSRLQKSTGKDELTMCSKKVVLKLFAISQHQM